jgi:hypothetical protein
MLKSGLLHRSSSDDGFDHFVAKPEAVTVLLAAVVVDDFAAEAETKVSVLESRLESVPEAPG